MRARAVVVTAIAVASLFVAPAAQADPPAGATFQYEFRRRVGNGAGEYAGYSDALDSEGTYSVLAVDGGLARVRATYHWSYSSSEGKSEGGREDREITFRVSDRRYVGGRTDLDEWDDKDASQLAVWFWIPPSVEAGATVQILDEPYVVVRRDATFSTGSRSVRAIELFHEGTSTRNDDYGTFTFRYEDRYYFDPATGMVIGESYSERDGGSYQGNSASFVLEETLEVSETSYPLVVDWSATLGALATGLGPFVGGGLLLVLLVILWVRRPRRVDAEGLGPVQVRRLRPGHPPLPAPRAGTTAHFAPFVADFVHKAHLAKDPVAGAFTAAGELVGVGMLSREAKIGTILSPNTDVAECLRKVLGAQDFFAEVRHPVPGRVRGQFAAASLPLPTENAYNAFETYQVLAVAPPPAPAYDTSVVSRLKAEDLPAIESLSRRVYKVPSARWLRAQLDGGDIGFVARLDGVLAGFALATLQGTEGRVHTNTVAPEHRGKGLGQELMRARLRALHDLGAERVITEIADWNLASLEVARRFGFVATGTLVVETSRTARVARAIVRR